MIIDNTKHLVKIQMNLSIMVMGFCLASVVGNLLNTANEMYLINVGILISIIVLSMFIYFFPGKKMQVVQFLQFLGAGIWAILFDTNTRFIGDLAFIGSILIAYIYRLINSYSYKAIIPPLVLLISLRIFAGLTLNPPLDSVDIYTTATSAGMLFLIITYFKVELKQYILESNKNETARRLGSNVRALNHMYNMGSAFMMCQNLRSLAKSNRTEKVLYNIDVLEDWLRAKESERIKFMRAVKGNEVTKVQKIGLHETLEAILTVERLNKVVLAVLKLRTDFDEQELYIKAAPFEIYFILQNLIKNAIEAILRMDDKDQIVLIKTRKKRNLCILTISDTGPGFPVAGKNGAIAPSTIVSSKEFDGGFGLQYVHSIMRQYGKIKIRNKTEERGAEIELNFKLITPSQKKELPKPIRNNQGNDIFLKKS